MSFVEDARKLLQDFVAPELRGINQRLDDIVAGLEKSFSKVEKSFVEVERLALERQQASEKLALERQQASESFTAERIQTLDKLAMERHNALLDRMELMRRELNMAIDLALAHRRIEELESRQRQATPVSGQTPA